MATEASKTSVFYKRVGKDGQDVDDKFDVNVPTANKVVLLVIYIGLLIGQYYVIWIEGEVVSNIVTWFVFFGLTLIPILLWAGLGPKLGETAILAWLHKVTKKKNETPVEFFVGFPSRVKDPYYIEANPMDFDIGNTKMFLNRVKEVIFLSVGISVLVAKSLAGSATDSSSYYYKLNAWWELYDVGYNNVNEMIMDTTIYLGPFALLFLFAIMPMIWLSEDVQIYRIDEVQDPHRLGTYLRAGLLSKILGFFGIVLAYDTANAWATDMGFTGINLYIQTFIQLGLLMLACSAAPFLVTLIYLLKYHEIWVNNIRIKASEFIPCATMQINHVGPEELEYLTHPEKIGATNTSKLVKFMETTAGRVVLVLLCILGLGMTFWLGFMFTGVWSMPFTWSPVS